MVFRGKIFQGVIFDAAQVRRSFLIDTGMILTAPIRATGTGLDFHPQTITSWTIKDQQVRIVYKFGQCVSNFLA